MATVVTYTCDRCGHTQFDSNTAPRAMYSVGVFCKPQGYTKVSAIECRVNALWCADCARPLISYEKKPEEPQMTLEDYLREIIREEIGEQS